jgi:hypothetical protein
MSPEIAYGRFTEYVYDAGEFLHERQRRSRSSLQRLPHGNPMPGRVDPIA